ncbi:hypothetical protein GOBAR_AA31884 [Gossypium barbadense]|uniref:Uncharacterized protein n=1 Tax=Gossypium barbadense TaxID=3634 RepID=A0A2P5WCJ5_GOSBA|nr:hypothetical protein GOBAR_AA31884 [Gossypium barbadense]
MSRTEHAQAKHPCPRPSAPAPSQRPSMQLGEYPLLVPLPCPDAFTPGPYALTRLVAPNAPARAPLRRASNALVPTLLL